MKRLLFVMLPLLLALGLTGAVAAESEPTVYTSGDYKYILLEDGTVEITDYTGEASELVIPAKIDKRQVTSLGAYAFYGCPSISVTIPDGVTSIQREAFSWSHNLASVSLPNSVTSIPSNPFAYCGSLTDIRISSSHPTLEIVDGVLFDKTEKRLISYPYANKASSYAIPQGTQVIGAYSFYNCDSLTSLTIPDSVTSIMDGALYNCKGLTGIELPNSIQFIGPDAFIFCNGLTSIVIPDSVTTIGDYAFASCENLASVSIPDSITDIGANPFRYCYDLTHIQLSASHPTLEVINGALIEKTEGRLVFYPCASKTKAFSIPQGVRIIGDFSFCSCKSLTSITIPNSVTSIGEDAFRNCSSLKSISIPNSVTSIGQHAFYYCSKLTSVSIPNSVTFIGKSAFKKCSSNLTLAVGRNSYARQYAIDNSIRYTN